MIEGIHVLNKIETLVSPVWANYLWILVIIGVIGWIIFSVIGIEQDVKWLPPVGLGFMCVCFVIVGILAAINPQIPNGNYIYEVTIDNSVTMNEFFDYYELIDQRDQIYLIKFKETYEQD